MESDPLPVVHDMFLAEGMGSVKLNRPFPEQNFLPGMIEAPLAIAKPANAKPLELPIEPPSSSELMVDFRTAKALGLTLAETFLVPADAVIE
jgi:hypothetical protein